MIFITTYKLKPFLSKDERRKYDTNVMLTIEQALPHLQAAVA